MSRTGVDWSAAASAVCGRLISPVLTRLNQRAAWWPLGVFQVGSGAPVRALSVAGRKVQLAFPAGEFEQQQWELNHLFNDDPYRLKRLKGEVETVLDVGANIGVFSLLARHYFPRARIHAYEPNPALTPILQANIAGLDIVTHAAGVGAQSARARIEGRDLSLYATLEPSKEGGIEIVGIEEAVERLGGRIDLLKLDCEGGEWSILTRPDFLRRVRRIAMEYHTQYGGSLVHLIDILKAHGFFIESLEESDNRLVGQLTAVNGALA